MIYPITLYGDPILKKPAQEVASDQVDVSVLVADMFETMSHASGVGLAAPQIGKSLRIFVMDSSPMKASEEPSEPGLRQVFINPKIIEENGEKWPFEEGCLSIPGIREDIMRASHIKITFFDEHWRQHTSEFDGVDARIIQHEYDHIEGILFTDHISAFKRRLLKGKLMNISKGRVDAEYRIKVPNRK
ncbi:MAG: peptide deformylase [Flammeovirgaceae bacterium]|nr:peptide deformylase [Flammeovirgaceae bacterium]